MEINDNEVVDFLISKFSMNFKKLEYNNNYSNDIFIGYKYLNSPVLFIKKFRSVLNFNKELYILKNFYSCRVVAVFPDYNIIVYNFIDISEIKVSFFKSNKFIEEFIKLIQSYHSRIQKDCISKNKLFYGNMKLSEKLKEVFNKLSKNNRNRLEKKLKALLQFSLIFDKEYSSLDFVLIHGDLSLRNIGIVENKLELFDFEHTRVGILYEDLIKLYYRELKNKKYILNYFLSNDLSSKLVKAVILFKESLGIYLYCESNEDKNFQNFGKYLERLSKQYFCDYLHENFTHEIDCGMFIKAYINNNIVLKKFYNYNEFYSKYRENFINSNYINKYISDCKSINILQPEINYSFEISNKIYLVQSYIKGYTLYDFEKLVTKKMENSTIYENKEMIKKLFSYYKALIVYLKKTYQNFEYLRIDLNTRNYIINSSDELILVDYIPPIYIESGNDGSYYQSKYKYIYSDIYLQLLVMSLYVVKPLVNSNLKDTLRKNLIKIYLENFYKITMEELGISNEKLLNLYKNNDFDRVNYSENDFIKNKIKNRVEGIDLYLKDIITIERLNDLYSNNSLKLDNGDGYFS